MQPNKLKQEEVLWADEERAYVIESLEGEGAFGAVYSAREQRSGARVAIKELHRVSPTAIASFKREFRTLQGVHHPNVVGLKHLVQHGDLWYIVMELVEGVDLRAFTRPGHDAPPEASTGRAPFDEGRVRTAFAGVARGLLALHARDILHLDLKPENVRVTPQGRAVLLDFGLAADLPSETRASTTAGAGTAAYMAPEQGGEERLTAATDWYALGTCLFETLTGELPFPGQNSFQILLAKRSQRAPSPRGFAHEASEDLLQLCERLLAQTPADRPTGVEVLRVLTGQAPTDQPSPFGTPPSGDLPLFRGREKELERLLDQLDDTDGGALRIVLIEGDSGVGKSALASELVRRAQALQPTLLCLSGRCYESEHLSYKAFDGCMDQLGKTLARMSPDACAAMLPRRARLLTELFPVLRGVKALAGAPDRGLSADPTTRRFEAFEALAALLAALASQRPLVLLIDDLQWADAESFRLLHALAQNHESLGLLLIATARARQDIDAATAARLEQVRALPCCSTIALSPLPRAVALELTAELLGPGAGIAEQNAIVQESAGHPFFIRELVRFALSTAHERRGPLTLEAALERRLAHLPADARALLELIALLDRPHALSTLAFALDGADVAAPARALLADHLLEQRSGDLLSCTHDRIRKAVLDRIDPARKPEMHARLAAALARHDKLDPAELARHWELGRRPDLARDAHALAGDGAMQALAFASAALHYERALSLSESPVDARWVELCQKAGSALARAGKSAEAAAFFARAAEQLSGEAGVRARILEAQQRIQCADVDAGLSAASAVLSSLSIPWPRGTAGKLWRVGWERAQVALMGTARKPPVALAANEKLALDALTALAYPVSWTDLLAGGMLTAVHLKRALNAADPAHIAQALSQEATFRAMQRPNQRAAHEALLARARKLADEVDDPALSARVEFMAGSTAVFYLDLPSAVSYFEHALETLETHCPGEPWLLNNVRTNLSNVLLSTGAPRALRRVEGWIAEARERQDGFAYTSLTGLGLGFLRHLMRDAPDDAARELAESMAPWRKTMASFPHLGEALAAASIGGYEGGTRCLTWFEREGARLHESVVTKVSFFAATVAITESFALLSAYPTASAEQKPLLLGRVKRSAQRISRAPSLMFYAAIARAQLAAITGRLDIAFKETAAVEDMLTGTGHEMQHAASYLRGVLEGGEAGARKRDAALSHFAALGWKKPLRAVSMHVPCVEFIAESAGRGAPRTPSRRLLAQRFHIREEAAGPFYDAVDTRTGRSVLVRKLETPAPEALRRFKHEFRALQRLHHPSLIRLEALFEHEGSWFVTMEPHTGTPLLEWLAPQSHTLDEPRTRLAFGHLLRALAVLHEAGFVHRDVRPEHVLITAEGRLVLRELGLLSTIGTPHDTLTEAHSLAYVAPEQLDGQEVGPSADLYGVGVCLYQALTGQLPIFHQDRARMLDAKRRARPVPPYALGLALPADLEKLCLALLERDPKARPSLETALAVLERRQDLPDLSAAPRASLLPPARVTTPEALIGDVFAGREHELEWLELAFASSRETFVLALVEGESGLGKTALVSEFLRRLLIRYPEALLFRSRCYENEQVAFEAFDAAIDELALFLRKLPNEEHRALLPAQPALLAQLFPVLGSVEAVGSAAKRGLPADPTARRMQAITALTSLLVALANKGPLVLAIDDLQWADAESFDLIESLSRLGQTLPVLVVATSRSPSELGPDGGRHLARLAQSPCVRVLPLGSMRDEDARAIVAALGGPVIEGQLSALVREGRGHPLFLRTLAMMFRAPLARARAEPPSLDAALYQRIDTLESTARELLELVALAGRPHGTHILARALSQPPELEAALSALRSAELVRLRRGYEIVCFHDRVRHAVVSRLDQPRMQGLAARLAAALELEGDVESADLARLWETAGEQARALDCYERAAEKALEQLAFAQAERLFQRALGLLDGASEERRGRLLLQRGRALSRAGRSPEAAEAYRAAAEHLSGHPQLEARILEAQQRIQGADVEAGVSAARAVLDHVGASWPSSIAGSLASIAMSRAAVAWRGLAVDLSPTPLSDTDKHALSALHQLSLPIIWTNLIAGGVLTAKHLRRALAARDPAHVARALAQEATFRAAQEPDQPQKQADLLERARELARGVGDPALLAHVEYMAGSVAAMARDSRTAITHLELALSIAEADCPGEPWLLNNIRTNLSNVLFALGTPDAPTRAERWIEEAKQRDDRFACASLVGLGLGLARHLMRDDSTTAAEELAHVMSPWPQTHVSFAAFGEAMALVYVGAYEGSRRGLDWLAGEGPRLARSTAFRTSLMREGMNHLEALAALSACLGTTTAERRALVARTRRALDVLLRSHSQRSHALLISAQLAALNKDWERALAQATDSYRLFTTAGKRVQSASAGYLMGLIEGGTAGKEAQAEALALLAAAGWKRPERAVSLYAPALDLIAESLASSRVVANAGPDGR